MEVKEHVDVLNVLRSNDPSSVIQSLYDDVYPKVTNYVTTNQGQKSDAEDIFQEALMKLLFYVKTDRIESGDKIQGFVYIVCINAWKSKRKKEGNPRNEKKQNESKTSSLRIPQIRTKIIQKNAMEKKRTAIRSQ